MHTIPFVLRCQNLGDDDDDENIGPSNNIVNQIGFKRNGENNIVMRFGRLTLLYKQNV